MSDRVGTRKSPRCTAYFDPRWRSAGVPIIWGGDDRLYGTTRRAGVTVQSVRSFGVYGPRLTSGLVIL